MGSFWRLNHHPKGVNVYFADDDDDDVLLGIRALTLVQHLFFTFVGIHFHIGETTKRNCCSIVRRWCLSFLNAWLFVLFFTTFIWYFLHERGRTSFKKLEKNSTDKRSHKEKRKWCRICIWNARQNQVYKDMNLSLGADMKWHCHEIMIDPNRSEASR